MRFPPSEQIRRRLLRCILEGQFEPGRSLPTIQVLAEMFGVSTKTVQKAIHALRKEGVIDAKRGVGLSVRPLDLRRSRGRKIGLVYPHKPEYIRGEPYPGRVIAEFESGLGSAGLVMTQCPISAMNRMALVETLGRLKLNGLALFEVDSDAAILELRELRLPMVSMDYDAYRHGVPSVVFDNVYGSFQTTRHLIGQGHRRIAFLRPLLRNPDINSQSLDAVEEERLKGYRVAMQDAGLPPDIREFELQGDALRKLLPDLLGRRPAPTAFVCVADWSAERIAAEILNMGFRIPEDVSIAGFGDHGAEFAPGRRITSVEIDCAGMGRAAARLLAQAMDGSGMSPVREILPTRLAEHESVAPPGPDRR